MINFRKNLKRLLFIFSLIFTTIYLNAQVYLIGPTLHYNIGAGLKNMSWGFEFSYWNYKNELRSDSRANGFDLGIEFEKTKTRIYSELQKGIGLGGSFGFVFEFCENFNYGGIQFSIWSSYYGGVELRYRRINQSNFFAPGVLFKIPNNILNPKLSFGNMFGNLM